MRVAVMGAGAVGGYFGARLAHAGHEVWFISRKERLKALRTSGLRVESIDGDLELAPIRATNDPSGIGPVDLVLFTVKSTGTRAAAEAIRPLVRAHTTVLALQNGVDNEAVLAEVLGEEPILPAVAVIGVDMPEPGLVSHTNNGSITMGEVDGSESERLIKLRRAFSDAGVETRASHDIRSVKWRKLVWNAAFNPLAALTGMRVLEIIEDEDARTLAVEAMREGIAVGRALGYKVDEHLVERGTRREPHWANSKTSMLQDIERGRPTEIEALTGAVVRYGVRTGLPTPVSSTIVRLVRARERGLSAPLRWGMGAPTDSGGPPCDDSASDGALVPGSHLVDLLLGVDSQARTLQGLDHVRLRDLLWLSCLLPLLGDPLHFLSCACGGRE